MRRLQAGAFIDPKQWRPARLPRPCPAHRTGYKVVRVRFKDGAPTGEYHDFLTGYVVDDGHVWGRPDGVAVALDGALLVSDDASNTLWRVALIP